jgi:hypothetical protein
VPVEEEEEGEEEEEEIIYSQVVFDFLCLSL